MRQLRLKKEDANYLFLYHGDLQEESVNKMKQYLDSRAETVKSHSFAENPLLYAEGTRSYQIGYVPCEQESVVGLPEAGSVFIVGSEGGFLIAAEYKNRENR